MTSITRIAHHPAQTRTGRDTYPWNRVAPGHGASRRGPGASAPIAAEVSPSPLAFVGSGDPCIVALRGDVDAANDAVLRSQLGRLILRDTVVDLTRLGFCGAGALDALFEHSGRLARSGAALHLACCPSSLRGIIERLGLHAALPISDTIAGATSALLLRDEP
ncbi:STAS domain-containing protein [Tomitella gaofuii]|uniref:STAS domain-containing protein n=1 Tax=Tomitella gaofuii TaxID=2760083 RepID=UPI0015F9BBC8|nr:STAS domain-containing protein [Tomitella gaofuii]